MCSWKYSENNVAAWKTLTWQLLPTPKIFPGELTEVFAPVQDNEPIEVTATLSPRP